MLLAHKGSAYRDAVLALSPTAFWRLGSDTTWGTNGIVDASGNSHHGNGTGTTYTLNQPGLLSDGDKAIVVPSQTPAGGIRVTQASWMESKQVSVAIAFKIPAKPSTDKFCLLTRRSVGGSFPWAIYIASATNGSTTPSTPAGGASLVTAQPPSAFVDSVSTGVDVCDGNKHLLIITQNDAGAGSIASVCYLDGTQTGSASTTGSLPTSGSLITGSDLEIGSELNGGVWQRGVNGGTIDEVGYWAGTVLNSTQVSNLWAAFNA
jgi:hypothetical protein